MELHRSPGRTCGRLLRDDAGQGLVEYAIIISIVVAATYAALSRLSAHVEGPGRLRDGSACVRYRRRRLRER